jgi:hypothetical protein
MKDLSGHAWIRRTTAINRREYSKVVYFSVAGGEAIWKENREFAQESGQFGPIFIVHNFAISNLDSEGWAVLGSNQ